MRWGLVRKVPTSFTPLWRRLTQVKEGSRMVKTLAVIRVMSRYPSIKKTVASWDTSQGIIRFRTLRGEASHHSLLKMTIIKIHRNWFLCKTIEYFNEHFKSWFLTKAKRIQNDSTRQRTARPARNEASQVKTLTSSEDSRTIWQAWAHSRLSRTLLSHMTSSPLSISTRRQEVRHCRWSTRGTRLL